MPGFPDELLWEKPEGVASVGFHLQHLSGVLDRLFTYARGEALDEGQLFALSMEGRPSSSVSQLVARFDRQVDLALSQLRATDSATLLEPRGIGRAQIPTNVIGLLVHAAEHTQRHLGQLLVTVKFLKTL